MGRSETSLSSHPPQLASYRYVALKYTREAVGMVCLGCTHVACTRLCLNLMHSLESRAPILQNAETLLLCSSTVSLPPCCTHHAVLPCSGSLNCVVLSCKWLIVVITCQRGR